MNKSWYSFDNSLGEKFMDFDCEWSIREKILKGAFMRYLQIAVVMVCLVLIGSVPLAISGTGKDLQGAHR